MWPSPYSTALLRLILPLWCVLFTHVSQHHTCNKNSTGSFVLKQLAHTPESSTFSQFTYACTTCSVYQPASVYQHASYSFYVHIFPLLCSHM